MDNAHKSELLVFTVDQSQTVLAQLTQLVHQYQLLAVSHDQEMLSMVDLLQKTQENWRKSVAECESLKAKMQHNKENMPSPQLATPKSGDKRKRRSSFFFRRSSSVPAANDELSENSDVFYDAESQSSAAKRSRLEHRASSEDILNKAIDENTTYSRSPSPTAITADHIQPVLQNFDRPHTFTTKRNFIKVNCGCCDTIIRFGVMLAKCSHCKGTFHPLCRNKAPLPCIARKETPSKGGAKGSRLRLGDHCPDCRPMVPPLIAFCTFHLDKHLSPPHNPYLQTGVETEIELKEMETISTLFKSSKHFPKLEVFSQSSVAGSILLFLKQIREPLIPPSYAKEFIGAAGAGNSDLLASLVKDLPLAHIDTLAVLCRHWQRLQDSMEDEDGSNRLASILGPYVFRVVGEGPEKAQAATLALQCLLQLTDKFWLDMLQWQTGSCISRNPSLKSNVSVDRN